MRKINHNLKNVDGLSIEQLKYISDYFMKSYEDCNKEVRHKHFLYYGKSPCRLLSDEHHKYYKVYKDKLDQVNSEFDK